MKEKHIGKLKDGTKITYSEFDAILSKVAPKLFNSAKNFTNYEEDFRQEAIANLIENLPKIPNKNSINPFQLRCIMFTTGPFSRSQQKQATDSRKMNRKTTHHDSNELSDIEQVNIIKDAYNAVKHHLTDLQQSIISLTAEGYTNKDISDILEVTLKKVSVHLAIAQNIMRNTIELNVESLENWV